MDISTIINVVTTQCRRFYVGIPMNVFYNIHVLMVQLGTSCSFNSPGLARNEPTPGEHPQGDSTPSVLSFFCGNMGIARGFMADYAGKAQHLQH